MTRLVATRSADDATPAQALQTRWTKGSIVGRFVIQSLSDL